MCGRWVAILTGPNRSFPRGQADAILTEAAASRDGAGCRRSAATGPTSRNRTRWTCLGYAAGLDMTRRDLQSEAKKNGRPWDMSKGFDHSAPLGKIVSRGAYRASEPRADPAEGER